MRSLATKLPLWAAILAVVALTAGSASARDELRLRARLAGPADGSTLKGHADYRLRDDGGRRKFSVEVERGTPGELHDVLVAGQVVGTVQIDDFGRGELEFDDQAGDASLSASRGRGRGSSGGGSGSGSGSNDDSDDSDDDSEDSDDSDDDSDVDSDVDSDIDSDDDSDVDSDDDSDVDSDDDSDNDSDDDSDDDNNLEQPFPLDFPDLNGGELIQVGPLTGTFQID